MNATIRALLLDSGISEADFFGRSTAQEIVSARKSAIDALRAKNLSVEAIARIMKRNRSTIQYWLYPGIHQRRIRKYCQRYRDKKAEQRQSDCFTEPSMAPDHLFGHPAAENAA